MPKTLDITVRDLTGTLAIVTGATDGVGFEIASRLATPGSESHQMLQLLSVIGTQQVGAGAGAF